MFEFDIFCHFCGASCWEFPCLRIEDKIYTQFWWSSLMTFRVLAWHTRFDQHYRGVVHLPSQPIRKKYSEMVSLCYWYFVDYFLAKMLWKANLDQTDFVLLRFWLEPFCILYNWNGTYFMAGILRWDSGSVLSSDSIIVCHDSCCYWLDQTWLCLRLKLIQHTTLTLIWG